MLFNPLFACRGKRSGITTCCITAKIAYKNALQKNSNQRIVDKMSILKYPQRQQSNIINGLAFYHQVQVVH